MLSNEDGNGDGGMILPWYVYSMCDRSKLELDPRMAGASIAICTLGTSGRSCRHVRSILCVPR